ncbi:NAD(P)-dependent oxidoreductase [Amycolatopsis sp. FDAARGOS 1241]|uniref:NAD(P)-dependent oxidoreductase n=1 Tax=Amycolatopsis sp. FDAARGOS 1241 TaxID=2778070 RepID=UPI00194E003E|nr:NAD(P)-dependent oxidoreductase [Amycolatopsis sp. FDAARGOS 1241]QRP43845.1 NAD(P)-dependent oxidoreductase [Amycolatopsis sp. FDAARGOS 1241]
MTTVAFLGTGIMGHPMAKNLVRSGVELRVWNRTRGKAEPLAEDGATVAGTPAEAAAGADVFVTMLADGLTVADVFAAANVAPGTVWLQMSTVGVEWVGKLAELAKAADVVFVDAPVMGTKVPAEQAQLQVLAAGPDDAHKKADAVFGAVGSNTRWLGTEPGTATRLKLVMNAWVLALTNATAESLALARALGVDPQLFFDVMTGTGFDVGYARMKGPLMLDGDYPASFPATLAAKDARLVVEAAGDAIDVAGTAATLAHLQAAVDAGHGEEDMAVLYRAVAKEA